MRREADRFLDKWWDSGKTKPLVLHGVRGCGKTHTARALGERKCPGYAYADLGSYGVGPAAGDMSRGRVVSDIRTLSGSDMPDGSLVILDNADMMNGLIVSVVIALSKTHRVIAVSGTGDVGVFCDRFRMEPMTFIEFLDAMGRSDLVTMLRCGRTEDFEELSPLFSEYMAVGGLPGAVSAWIETGDERVVDAEIRRVLGHVADEACRDVTGLRRQTVLNVLNCAAEHLARPNRKFMMSRIPQEDGRAAANTAIRALRDADALYKVNIRSDGTSSSFKLYLFDTGAARVLRGVPLTTAADPFFAGYLADGLAENAVYLELDRSEAGSIWGWRSGNKAEAQFVILGAAGDVPIQVTNRPTFYPMSLRAFVRHDPSAVPIYMSPAPPELRNGIHRVPLYGACTVPSRFGFRRIKEVHPGPYG